MREERHAQDPYAPPPRHKDKSGALVRVVLIAAMLGVAVWGYTQYADGPTLVAEQEAVQEQQVADAGYSVTPEAIPQGAPTDAPAAASDESAPAPAAEPVSPSTTTTP